MNDLDALYRDTNVCTTLDEWREIAKRVTLTDPRFFARELAMSSSLCESKLAYMTCDPAYYHPVLHCTVRELIDARAGVAGPRHDRIRFAIDFDNDILSRVHAWNDLAHL